MLWLILNSGIRTKLLSNPESGSGQVLKSNHNFTMNEFTVFQLYKN